MSDPVNVTIRVNGGDLRARLEHLRKAGRLRSYSEVVRLAVDLLSAIEGGMIVECRDIEDVVRLVRAWRAVNSDIL